MAQTETRSAARVLLATASVSAVLGSVHAFSVFLIPIEQAFGASRSAVSLTYSFALVALTVAVRRHEETFGVLETDVNKRVKSQPGGAQPRQG